MLIEERMYTPMNKFHFWGEGEWVREPDIVIWDYRGILCKARRIMHCEGHNHDSWYGGHWCGYIQVPVSHPWYAKDYDNIEADCHGGLTYARAEPDWWIGFDCAHSDDLSPSLEKVCPELYQPFPEMPEWRREYRNKEFVMRECESLVRQLWEVVYASKPS